MYFEWLIQSVLDGSFAIESDEPETSWTTCIFIHHQRRIHYTAESRKKILKLFFRRLLTNTAHEYLARLLLLIAWYGSFRVNLYGNM